MIVCGNCKTNNKPDSVFCMTCGTRILAEPTVSFSRPTASEDFGSEPAFAQQTPVKQESVFTSPVAIVFMVLAAVAVGIFIYKSASSLESDKNSSRKAAPDHFGIFIINGTSGALQELRRSDYGNLLDAKTSLTKDSSLGVSEPKDDFFLYYDSKEVPVSSLRLVLIDSINKDGSLKEVKFQASPNEGTADLKTLRVPNGLANGRYAFALLDEFFNAGSHKLWAFEVRSGSGTQTNTDVLSSVIPMKGGEKTSGAFQVASIPPVSGWATCNSNYAVFRTEPSQHGGSSTKIRNLYRGESVYVLEYSSNIEQFNGKLAPFANIRTENGEVGWVWAGLLSR